MKRSLPLIGSVTAVVAVAVGVALVSSSSGTHRPRPLRLASGGTSVARDAALAPGTPAGSAPGTAAGSSGYTLTGTLPAGQPEDAPAYTLSKGPADADLVKALAKALDVGTPIRDGSGWRAGGLFVSGDAGQSWWYAPCAKDMAVSSNEQVGCAVAVPGVAVTAAPDAGSGSSSSSGASGNGTTVAPPPSSPSPAPAPMSDARVKDAVQPVLDALGLSVDTAHIEGWPYGGSASVPRTVGGLDAIGLETSVQVDRLGQVTGANGWLADPVRGDSYPLITAQQAYDQLPPVMRAMLCPVGPDGQGCAQPEPTEVTGAHLGLTLNDLADGGKVLVPAWLFEIKGWTVPQAVVAVQKQYLPQPTEPTADPGTPGEVPPAPPVPPAPANDPAGPQTFSFDGASRGAEPNQLVLRWGDSSSCPHENVTADAKEDPKTVYVVLRADARDPDVPCTEDYRAMHHTITLQAPLGDRQVVDASTGKAVPLT